MIVSCNKEQYLKNLIKLTLINILNAKGVIYNYYKQKNRKENMPDQTLDEIRIVQENNKARLYEKRKAARDQLEKLLTQFSSDDLIDLIMKIQEENN